MGYTTYFNGQFDVNPPLKEEHRNFLEAFASTRRMKRDAVIAESLSDPVRLAAELPIGADGAYFVGGEGWAGQSKDGSIVDYNQPPCYQPGLWCQWVPSEDGTAILWNEAEKFYEYINWIEYLIEHFLEPWGYTVNGDVSWSGEEDDDRGIIRVTDNRVEVLEGQIVYEPSTLEEYAKQVLQILERDEDWSPSTIDEIGCLAVKLGLAHTNDHGLFKVGQATQSAE